VTTRELCACNEQCGRPAVRRGYSDACARRWIKAGCPDTGPLPPMRGNWSDAARAASAASRGVTLKDGDGSSDPYDLQWAAGAPERHITGARPRAAALAACVGARDALGVQHLANRMASWDELMAVALVLAECADPVKVAAVCGTVAAERRAA
jgi:hypothetical protein